MLSKSISSATAALVPLFLLQSVQGQAPTMSNSTRVLTGFEPCDALISANLSHAVHMPTSPLYPSLVNAYWSLTTRRRPWCFVLPSTALEVSRTLTALGSAGNGAGDWHVAIRSGGHGTGESNNIVNGVTIDLSQLNATTYNAAANVTSVGTGARWQNVYDTLQPQGLSVTGGREGVVGVGGFILGGGNSWYTARTGFGCDGVVNYEVVLANGEIINANASANSDLWRALKGGGSNFGIVTRFDLETYPITNLTREFRFISEQHVDEVINAVHGFADLDRSHQDNAMLTLVAFNETAGGTTITVMEINTKNDANTTAFATFNQIPTLAPGTKESLTLAKSADSAQVGASVRGAGSYLTIANDKQVMRYCIDQHTSLVTDLRAMIGAENFTTILEFQPMPSYYTDIGQEKGGNMLGLEHNIGNKLFFVAGVVMASQDSEDQYPLASQRVNAMVQNIAAFSKSVGRSKEFTYMNYAQPNQDVLGSYGAANVEYLKQVANKYDSGGFFQSRVPGGFKISRVD